MCFFLAIAVSFCLKATVSYVHSFVIGESERKFMEKDSMKAGTVVVDSSVHYRVLSSGITYWELVLPVDWIRRQPRIKSVCECRYEVLTASGRTIENSDMSTHMIVSDLIPGLQDVLLLMREGDFFEIVVPLSLVRSHGRSSNGDLMYKHVSSDQPALFFRLELIAVVEESDSMSMTEKLIRLCNRKPIVTFCALFFTVKFFVFLVLFRTIIFFHIFIL